jgi:alkylation response protein AidB-like acyl-CoA dehydrogenase
MFDYLLDNETISFRNEIREFVKTIPRQMILDMDSEKIQFPKDFLKAAAQRNLLGCRYPKQWGGAGLELGIQHCWH